METNELSSVQDDAWMTAEEKNAILRDIERLPEAARETSVEEALGTRARRKGALFPALVNLAGLAVLAVGFLILSRLHSQDVLRIRESQGALGLTERRLIEEIRKENAPVSRSGEELAGLLKGDAKVRAAEAQLEGLYQVIAGDVRAGRLADAEKTLAGAKEFLDAPGLEGLPSWEETKRLQAGAIASLEALLARAQPENPGAEAEKAALQEQIALLEQQNKEQAQSIEAFGSQGDGLSRRIAALEGNVRSLQAEAAAGRKTLEDREAALTELRSQNAAAEQQIAALRSQGSQAEREIAALNSRSAEAARQISALQAKASQDAEKISGQDKSIAALKAENAQLAAQGEKQRKSLDAIGGILNEINNTTVSELPLKIEAIRQLVEQ